MSPRGSLLLVMLFAVLALRLYGSKKVSRAWSAIWGISSGSPLGASIPASTPGGAVLGGGGAPPAGFFPTHTLFGLPVPSFLTFAQSYLGQDSGNFPAGDPAVGDFDYGTGGKSVPVPLPPDPTGKGYTVIAEDYSSVWGWREVLKDPIGGEEVYMHLLQPFLQLGHTYKGGTSAGMSGYPLQGSAGFGVSGPANAHLSVIVDQLGLDWLFGLSSQSEQGYVVR